MSERRYIDVFIDGLIAYFDHLNESFGLPRNVINQSDADHHSVQSVGLELGTPYLLKCLRLERWHGFCFCTSRPLKAYIVELW